MTNIEFGKRGSLWGIWKEMHDFPKNLKKEHCFNAPQLELIIIGECGFCRENNIGFSQISLRDSKTIEQLNKNVLLSPLICENHEYIDMNLTLSICTIFVQPKNRGTYRFEINAPCLNCNKKNDSLLLSVHNNDQINRIYTVASNLCCKNPKIRVYEFSLKYSSEIERKVGFIHKCNEESCGVCENKIREYEKLIQCSCCQIYFHMNCLMNWVISKKIPEAVCKHCFFKLPPSVSEKTIAKHFFLFSKGKRKEIKEIFGDFEIENKVIVGGIGYLRFNSKKEAIEKMKELNNYALLNELKVHSCFSANQKRSERKFWKKRLKKSSLPKETQNMMYLNSLKL